jgi:hypothetical protein
MFDSNLNFKMRASNSLVSYTVARLGTVCWELTIEFDILYSHDGIRY